MGVGPLVPHHADGPDVGEHGERLPQLALEARPRDLLADDRIGVLEDRHPLGGDLADDPHAEAGSWERLAHHDLVR